MGTKKNSLYLLSLCLWLLLVPVGATSASSPSEIKEAFPLLDFDQSLFTSAEPSPQVEVIQSPYNHKPAGVGITYKLDPEKRYLVSISGQLDTVRPQLGIQIVGAPDRILAAPKGEIFINVFNTPKITLYLNIHPKIKYRLSSIHFLECPQCINRKELIQLIQKDKPQLETLLKRDRLLAAQSILDWTANITPIALSKPFFDKTENFNRMAPEEIYNLFNLNIAGVYCGGASLFLNKILTLFEIDSFTLDFGDINNLLTHTTVVVAKHSGDHWKYYIFDPTFNVTFQNPKSAYYLTFTELMDLPLENINEKVKINQRSLHKRKYLAIIEDAKLCPRVKVETQDYLICSISDYTMKYYFHQNNPTFVKSGYSKNLTGFLQLLRNRVFSIGGFSKQSSRKQFMEILKVHDIPLGHNP